MAAVVLDSNEIGRALSDHKLHELMTQVFGKSFGKTAIISKSKQVSRKNLFTGYSSMFMLFFT